MPTYTTINRLQVPALTDAPNVESATAPIAGGVEQRCLMPFATRAARNTAIPTPTEGMMCYIADYDDIQLYSGGTWVSAGPRIVQLPETNIPDTSTTIIDTIPLEPNSVYHIFGIVHSTQTTGGIILGLRVSQSGTIYWDFANASGADNIHVNQYLVTTDNDPPGEFVGVRTTASGSGSLVDGILMIAKVG